MKKPLFAVIGALFITGCSTTAVQVKDAVPAPAAQILLKNSLSAQGNARTVFVRDTGLVGSAVFQHVFIDGVEAIVLNPGEKAELILEPGEHIFGVIPTDPFGASTLTSIDQDLKANRTYYYRILTQGDSMVTTIQRFMPQNQ